MKKDTTLRRRNSFSFSDWRHSGLFVFGCILLIFFSISFIREAVRNYEIDKEVATLEQEIAKLENKNVELASVVQYLNTDLYREKEARLRLNLQESGEKVVAVPDDYLGNDFAADDNSGEHSSADRRSNPLRWWNYFFGDS